MEHKRTEMRTVESFVKTHYSFIIAILSYKSRLNVTEENKKQEPTRQHSTMSSIKYQISTQKSGLFLKKSNFTKKNYTQKWGKSPKIMAKNPGIA